MRVAELLRCRDGGRVLIKEHVTSGTVPALLLCVNVVVVPSQTPGDMCVCVCVCVCACVCALCVSLHTQDWACAPFVKLHDTPSDIYHTHICWQVTQIYSNYIYIYINV